MIGAALARRFPIAVALVHFVLFALAISGITASGCRAQRPTSQRTSPTAFAPSETRRLRDFGAAGDGRADDTAALTRALSNADWYCLDGEGRTYRVAGTLRVQSSLCLRNLTIIQSLAPFDTRPFITHSCPVELNASAVSDCGDPELPAAAMAHLEKSLSVRTLLIRSDKGTPVRVVLDHVKVIRGLYPEGGSRTDSAGIWLEGADAADLRNVEVTGDGKGYGLIVLRSRNLHVDDLWIHDIVWSPYAGDAPLSRDRVAAVGWNSVPIHEFRQAGRDGARASKFYGVRVQEQVTCALFSEVQDVTIRNPRISHCMARFQDGDLPWQADGLDISRSSSNVRVDGAVIDSTWEGMDVAGNGDGITGLVISNPRVSNSFGFGLKFGYHLRNARITNAVVTNSGIAGIVLYGPVSGVTVAGAQIEGVGQLTSNGRTFVPWLKQTHSGIRIDEGSRGTEAAGMTPRDVTLDNVDVGSSNGARYEFGLLNTGGSNVRIRAFRARGFSRAQLSGPAKSLAN